MSFHTPTSELKNIKLNIVNHFDTNKSSRWKDNVLNLNNSIAKGKIEVVPVSETIFFLDFDLEFFLFLSFDLCFLSFDLSLYFLPLIFSYILFSILFLFNKLKVIFNILFFNLTIN